MMDITEIILVSLPLAGGIAGVMWALMYKERKQYNSAFDSLEEMKKNKDAFSKEKKEEILQKAYKELTPRIRGEVNYYLKNSNEIPVGSDLSDMSKTYREYMKYVE